MLTDIGKFFRSHVKELERIYLDHNLEIRHFLRLEAFPDNIVHKQHTGIRVVHQIVYVAGLEFMEDGNGHCAISDGCQEADSPVGLVAGAYCNFVTLFEAALFKSNMKLGYPQGHLTVCEGHALVVGKGRAVPIVDEALL